MGELVRVYEFENSNYTGAFRDVDPFGQVNPPWFFVVGEPPAQEPGKFLRLAAGGWEVADEPYVEPERVEPVPVAVDMRQARLKLLSEPHGEGTRLDAVNAYVETQDANVEIEWSFARELRRDHPMVGIMGFFFGMDSDDLDQWFREAAAIGPTLAL